MFLAEKKALDELIKEMKENPIFYEKVEEVIVSGSRVRGDFTGITFSVVVKDKQTYDREKRFRTGFALEIEEEGITIYKKEN